MAGETLDLARIRAAAEAIRPYLHRTPLVCSRYLSDATGARVYLKLENQQRTGSFKPRGALVSMLALGAEDRKRGVITISAGNHAQAVAFAGRLLGIPVTVVMPATAAPVKVAASRGYGAEVILHGDVHQAFAKLEELLQERSLTLIHPFDSIPAMTGQATVGLEIFAELPEINYLLAGVGGGGLAVGSAFALKALKPAVRTIGIEPEGASSMHQSRATGRRVRLERTDTIADGLAAPFCGERNLAIGAEVLDDVVLVEDRDIVAGMTALFERVKTVAEPAGAAATGALLAGKVKPVAGSTVVAIVSGGNIAAPDFARLVTTLA